jgi:hypothetical protein
MRREDWPEALHTFLAERRTMPFAWGSNDCVIFAFDAIERMTGTDPFAPFRASYDDRAGAYRNLRDYAGAGLAEAVERLAAAYAMEEVPPLHAQRGDLVMLGTTLGDALGICVGAVIACTGPEGLALAPIGDALRAWRV